MALAFMAPCAGWSLTTEEIRMRDPFVVTDTERGVYCLVSSYFTPGCRGWGFRGDGVQIYESKDLVTWEQPRQVLKMPKEIGCRMFWAPEIHRYKDKWYVFGTVNTGRKNSAGGEERGTWTFVSDSLRGPYRPTGGRSVTPPEWQALDGTLWVEDGRPYMVFCHEWCQPGMGVGTVCAVELTDDLSSPVGKPKTLFKATDWKAMPSKDKVEDHVTDGTFLYRSPKSGKLFMLWSNIGPGHDYLQILSESVSGKLAGPWTNHRILFGQDGGHGMVFRKLDGTLCLTLHQTNRPPNERPKFFDLVDDGVTLRLYVNDCDGGKRTFREWTPGIGGVVSAAQFGHLAEERQR